MTRLRWPALFWPPRPSPRPAGLLSAGDLYGDKDGPRPESFVPPKPGDVQTFSNTVDNVL